MLQTHARTSCTKREEVWKQASSLASRENARLGGVVSVDLTPPLLEDVPTEREKQQILADESTVVGRPIAGRGPSGWFIDFAFHLGASCVWMTRLERRLSLVFRSQAGHPGHAG